MYLLTQLSICNAVQIRNKFVELRKFLNAENFSVRRIAPAQVQKISDRKVFLNFLIFFRKNNVDDCSIGTTFFLAECAKWSPMIGRLLRWKIFHRKLNK